MKPLSEIYTGKIYADEDVLATAPRSSGKEKVETFKLGRWVNNDELLKEYESRGLEPASLDATLSLEKKHAYVATIWDVKGISASYLAFDRDGDGGRGVDVDRGADGWSDGWLFAGVRKSSALKSSAHSDTLPLELPNELVINNVTYRKV